jgi:hypothetical protein
VLVPLEMMNIRNVRMTVHQFPVIVQR